MLVVRTLLMGPFFGLRSALDWVRGIGLNDLKRDSVTGLEVSCFEPNQVLIGYAWAARS